MKVSIKCHWFAKGWGEVTAKGMLRDGEEMVLKRWYHLVASSRTRCQANLSCSGWRWFKLVRATMLLRALGSCLWMSALANHNVSHNVTTTSVTSSTMLWTDRWVEDLFIVSHRVWRLAFDESLPWKLRPARTTTLTTSEVVNQRLTTGASTTRTEDAPCPSLSRWQKKHLQLRLYGLASAAMQHFYKSTYIHT